MTVTFRADNRVYIELPTRESGLYLPNEIENARRVTKSPDYVEYVNVRVNKIGFIKALRCCTEPRMGLKDAKDFAEAFALHCTAAGISDVRFEHFGQ